MTQVVAKGALFALNVSLWLGSLAAVFLARGPLRILLAVFPTATLAYLLLELRYVEARYLLQCYPVFYLGASLAFVSVIERARGVRGWGAPRHQRSDTSLVPGTTGAMADRV
jgi:hypothetical protein